MNTLLFVLFGELLSLASLTVAVAANGFAGVLESFQCLAGVFQNIFFVPPPPPSREPAMDLETALQECSSALDLFLNNRFSDALALLEPW